MNKDLMFNISENDIKKKHAKKILDLNYPLLATSKIKYEEKLLQIKRVTKVVKGGKKMTFRAIVIVGDNYKNVGVGIGRAEDVNLAIEKAVLSGKKHLITVPITYQSSIPHIVKASFGACDIMLRPAAEGSGVIAGGSIKAILELAGFKNILAKQFGSKNILNNVRATLLALKKLNKNISLGALKPIRIQTFYKKLIKS